MGFRYKRIIYVQDTDATGVLYFANQFKIGLEAFEEFLLDKGFSFNKMVNKKDFSLPVVHAEADFIAPLFMGDAIEVTLTFQMGTTSFTHFSNILKEGKEVGTVSIVHVVYSSATKSSIRIPPQLKQILA